ncbi:MAG: nuclear transport factor 2 family protein [Mycobacterium sp.]
MTPQKADAEDSPPDDTPPEDTGSLAPFIAGAVIFGIVVIGIALSVIFRSDDGLTPEGRIGRTVVAQNDALQRRAYPEYVANSCRAIVVPEQDLIAAQGKSEASRGNRYVDDVKDIKISGDAATAQVRYHYTKSEDNKVTADVSFVKEDGSWRVCARYQ